MGTIVHGSGLLVNILNRADFESRVYAAIVSPPERDDLWQEFESIYRDPENDNRLEEAEAFYRVNQKEMDTGVEVLWPSRFSYARLMMEKVNIGSRAFGSEFMNNPIDEETQIFRPSTFTYFDYDALRETGANRYHSIILLLGTSPLARITVQTTTPLLLWHATAGLALFFV